MRVERHGVVSVGEGRGDLAVEKILAHLQRITQQRIAVAARPRLLVNDQRAFGYHARDLARQRATLVADLDEVARRSAGLAARETVGLKLDAVGAQLQQRLVGQDAIGAANANAAAY